MKKSIVLISVLAAVSMLSGCAGFAFSGRGVALGGLYADTAANEQVTENVVAAKSGKSCASSILGFVTTGDASAATAAKNGGITKIGAVDHHHTNILGIYATYCVIVTGE